MSDLPVVIPNRSEKPRTVGRTHVLDAGVPTGWLKDQLSLVAPYIDLAKLGWGTSVVTPELSRKIDVYRAADVEVCMGGTLFELALLQGRIDEYERWLKSLGVGVVEVSDGSISISHDDKLRAIERFAESFVVYSEVGSKDADAIVSPVRWVRSIKAELKAGAKQVILEGRESGTAGLYRRSGEMRTGLVDEILESGIGSADVIFEAPVKSHQVYLVSELGPEVNFGNIPLTDVLSLETIRLGLRGDTLLRMHMPDDG